MPNCALEKNSENCFTDDIEKSFLFCVLSSSCLLAEGRKELIHMETLFEVSNSSIMLSEECCHPGSLFLCVCVKTMYAGLGWVHPVGDSLVTIC